MNKSEARMAKKFIKFAKEAQARNGYAAIRPEGFCDEAHAVKFRVADITNVADNEILFAKWEGWGSLGEYSIKVSEEAFQTENKPVYNKATGTFRILDVEGDRDDIRFVIEKTLKG